ncbi:hypothetical protein SRB5_38460 [Streptomyces sp. RB5]|uniref:Protein-glutamine gamma-glutamyltransferase-like C-terminal domain-containing protein n=1 Tax=Streptomyces smaragdinus TaxID=2585196 RepID=A0A7K0CJS1_9ACTN|nr:hypothetical protein [Streptomyces smaragdinus]
MLLLVAVAVLGLRAGEGFDPAAGARTLPGGPGWWIALPLGLGLLTMIVTRSGLVPLTNVVMIAAVCVGIVVLVESGSEGTPEKVGIPRATATPKPPAESAGGGADVLFYLGVGIIVVILAAVTVYLLNRVGRTPGLLEARDTLRPAAEDVLPAEEDDGDPGGDSAVLPGAPVPRNGVPTDDHRGAVIATYALLERTLSRSARITRRPFETPEELLRRARRKGLPTADAEELGRLYAAARYSEHPVTGEERERARRALVRQRAAWGAPSGGPE